MDSIKDMEEKINKIHSEIIRDPQHFVDRAINMANSSEQEILILCGTNNVFELAEKINLMRRAEDMATKGTTVKLLIPDDKALKLKIRTSSFMQKNVRFLDSSLQNDLLIMIIDGKRLILLEKPDGSGGRLPEVVTALYSETKAVTASYHRFVDSIWRHVKLDEELTNSRNELARMAEELEFLFESLAESNKDLLAANERLAANEQMQREFINIAAHELRTPIQPILGAANIIESQFEDGKEKIEITRDDIELIIRNAKRLERLSSEVLEVARIDSNSLKLEKELVSLHEVIKSTIEDTFRTLEDINGLRFEVNIPKDVFIYADKERVNEVLYNLLDNAAKFTKKGVISVNATVENNKVHIQVSDTGTGIDSEIYPKLFTKFASKSERGTGLGLYIAKNIVEAHGGKIWAENNRAGIGATFTFTLPSS